MCVCVCRDWIESFSVSRGAFKTANFCVVADYYVFFASVSISFLLNSRY